MGIVVGQGGFAQQDPQCGPEAPQGDVGFEVHGDGPQQGPVLHVVTASGCRVFGGQGVQDQGDEVLSGQRLEQVQGGVLRGDGGVADRGASDVGEAG